MVMIVLSRVAVYEEGLVLLIGSVTELEGAQLLHIRRLMDDSMTSGRWAVSVFGGDDQQVP